MLRPSRPRSIAAPIPTPSRPPSAVAIVLSAIALVAAGDPDPDAEFLALLDAARANPETFDARALRVAAARVKGFDPAQDPEPDASAVERELANGERAAALLALDRLLARHWTDIEAHAYAARVCRRLRDDDRAALHTAFMRRLLASILDSGDGSAAAPYAVVSRAEERVVLAIQGNRSTALTTTRDRGRQMRVHLCESGARVHFTQAAAPTGGASAR